MSERLTKMTQAIQIDAYENVNDLQESARVHFW